MLQQTQLKQMKKIGPHQRKERCSKEIKDIKKNQMEILELRNTTEKKNLMDIFNSKMEGMEEKKSVS